jgi:hypothetical protein
LNIVEYYRISLENVKRHFCRNYNDSLGSAGADAGQNAVGGRYSSAMIALQENEQELKGGGVPH